MKIEKISATQIRCTLDRSDLHSRDLKLSELAYGTEKAKNLFHDMIEQASFEFDFDADDSPLMIEAVPVSPDCIILTITKVVHPEELDDKFPVFNDDDTDDDEEDEEDDGAYDEYPDLVNMSMADAIEQMRHGKLKDNDDLVPIYKTLSEAEKEPSPEYNLSTPDIKIYSFNSWNDASNAAADCLKSFDTLDFASRFYKDEADGKYCLILESNYRPNESFNGVAAFLSEYGTPLDTTYATLSYIREHCNMLIREDALRILKEY